jgi:hypothetical protein
VEHKNVNIMKLKIDYAKKANGLYNGTIRVIDTQDFPTNHIFSEKRVVGQSDYDIDEADSYVSTYENQELEKLEKLLKKEIEAVKVLVQKYRDMPVPVSEIIEF